MLSRLYLESLRQALRSEGIWGRPAGRLMEELEDHYTTTLNRLRGEGREAVAAEALAAETLGEPGAVARHAAAHLQEGCWMARRPWLFAAGLFLGTALATPIIAYWVEVVFFGFAHGSKNPAALVPWIGFWELAMSWIPFLAGTLLLLGLARRYPLGWKALLPASVALGLGGSLLACYITPALHGPGSGYMDVSTGSLPGFIGAALANLDPRLRGVWGPDNLPGLLSQCFAPTFTLRLILPLLLCLGLRHFFRQTAMQGA